MTSSCRSQIPGGATFVPATSSSSRTAPACVVTLDGDVWMVRGLHDPVAPIALAALRVRSARAVDPRHSRRADLRLRSQRHLALARHQRRRRGRRPRAVLERIRADRRHARVSEHGASRARLASSSSPRADRRRRRSANTTAACCASPPTGDGDGPRLRIPPAEHRRQRAHRPRHGERSAGPLHPITPLHIVARSSVLRLPQRQARRARYIRRRSPIR